MRLDREIFYQPDVNRLAYPHSAALVKYLLDGERGQLGKDIEELEEGFRQWLWEEDQTVRQRLAHRMKISREP